MENALAFSGENSQPVNPEKQQFADDGSWAREKFRHSGIMNLQIFWTLLSSCKDWGFWKSQNAAVGPWSYHRIGCRLGWVQPWFMHYRRVPDVQAIYGHVWIESLLCWRFTLAALLHFFAVVIFFLFFSIFILFILFFLLLPFPVVFWHVV